MGRAVPLATGSLVGVCVFAWLAGPILEARFGAEALLAAYGGVAVGTAATTYVLVSRLDARLTGGTGSDDAAAADSPDADSTDRRRRSTDADDDAVTVRLEDLEDLDVEREVRRLKAERSSSGDED